MQKWLAMLLAAMLAISPLSATASWLGDFGGYDSDYSDSSGYGDIFSLFSDILSETDGSADEYSYDPGGSSSGMDDLFSLFGDVLGGGSSWTEDSYSSGYDDSAYGSLFGDVFGSDDSYSTYGSSAEDIFSLFSGWMEDEGGYDSSAGQYGQSDMYSLFGNWLQEESGEIETWANPASSAIETPTGDEDTTWAFYWYLCGSDLESNGGMATNDLNEMLKAALPENVTVVIQTGGARQWQNNVVNARRMQRWLYQGGELSRIDDGPAVNMGEMRSLADFLDFCNRNFQADKRAVIFWNHGGGSVTGAAFDEQYNYDALTLSEMREAFERVFDPSQKHPPLEMVGFDTCLMATVDVAHTFNGMARYLVASEEYEPGTGWDYETLFKAVGEDPGMSGAKLGRIICDSYAAACRQKRTHNEITLSVTDLTKTDALIRAFETFGMEALKAAATDKSFYSRFARAAARTENYGGNTREQGYANMVDLGHLARLTTDLVPSAQDVIDALDQCILYRVNGEYRSEATGLSCYYSLNGNVKELQQYIQQGVGDAFAQYALYGLTGNLTDEGMAYLQAAQTQQEQIVHFETLADTNWDGMALTVDGNGTACLSLGPQADEILAGIGFQLFWIDQEEDVMLFFGTDNDMEGDWEEGVFCDNFRGVWGAINGQLVYMELSYEGEDYNLYSVPILLNDEECHLQIAYDFLSEEWEILGARAGLEDSGMSHKDIRLLREGDVLCPVWYGSSFSGDDDFVGYVQEPITITDDLAFGEAPLPDGLYGMMFEMWDAQNNYAYSQPVYFECADGEIYTYQE